MKNSIFSKIALLACVLGVASFTTASAQDASTTPPADGGHHWHHDSVLTADEQAELKKDHDQVFAANPDLKTEGKDLWDQRKGMKDASEADKQAFHEKFKAYRDKVNAAIEAIDPNAAALIAKLEAAHPHHHDGGAAAPASGQ